MRPFLVPILAATALFWAGTFYIFFTVPPKLQGNLVVSNVIYFFGIAFITIGLTVALLHYVFSFVVLPKSRVIDAAPVLRGLLRKSLRRGFLFSGLVVGLFGLNALQIINILNAILVVGIIILIEMYFSNR